LFFRPFLPFAVAAFLVIGSLPAYAQEATSPEDTVIRIGIVDLTAVRQNSSAMKSVNEQIASYRETFQKDIQEEEASLRDANQELSRQRTVLSAEAFEEARRQFEDRVAEVQRKVQQRKNELESARAVALRELHQSLNLIIAEIAKERGLTLVLRRDQTVLSAKSLEITTDVTERLNSQLPNLTVSKPGQ